ncbi:MAG: HEAT repeat domain-containing protein [bacterium]
MPRLESGYTVPLEEGDRQEDPFRGVRAFDRESTNVFSGRKEEIKTLVELIAREDFRAGVLTGEAGVGKTSLLLAGLVPRLERVGTLPVYVGGDEDIAEALRKSVFQASSSPPRAEEDPVAYALRQCERWPEGLLVVFDDLADRLTGEQVDQFVSTVRRLLHGGQGRLMVLFCVDSNAFHRLAELERRVDAAIPPRCRLHLERLTLDRAAEAIEQGVLASGTYFEAGLSQSMALDLTRDGPVLPLDLQLTVSMAIERRALTAKRYARSGGAAVLRAEWLRHRLREAGYLDGLLVLSELADRRRMEAGWCSDDELSTLTGLARDRLQTVLQKLTRADLIHENEQAGCHRLSQSALIPLIRGLDGELRARRLRARLTVRHRLSAGGFLGPMELLRARHATAASEEESTLIRRSKILNSVGMGLIAAILLVLGWWVHDKAGAGYHLGLGGAAGRTDRTVVVKRGQPAYARFAPLPHRPPVGSILEDTGFPEAALRKGARLSQLRGSLSARRGRWPLWFAQALDALEPTYRGHALLLLGDQDEGWKIFTRAADSPAALRRITALIRIAGSGKGAEQRLLERAAKHDSVSMRHLALDAALAVSRRTKGAYRTLLEAAATDAEPAVRRQLLSSAQGLGARRALQLAARALQPPHPSVQRAALALAVWGADKAPTEAAAVLAASVDQLIAQPQAPPRRTLERLLRDRPAAAARGVAASLKGAQTSAARRQILTWLSSVDARSLPAKSLAPLLLKLAESDDPTVAELALILAVQLAPLDPVRKLLHSLSRDKGKSGTARRILAAHGYGALLRLGRKFDLASLRLLAQDLSVEVRVAAVQALGAAPRSEILTLMRLGNDPSAQVRSALIQSMATVGNPEPYSILRPLQMLTQGGGARVKAAMATAAGTLVRSKRYWAIAENFVISATRSGAAGVRRAGVTALGKIAHLRTEASFEALKNRLTDQDSSVRAALVDALATVGRKAPIKAGLLLVSLATDPTPIIALKALSLLITLSSDSRLHAPMAQALPKALRSSDTVRLAALELMNRLPAKVLPKGLDSALAHAFHTAATDDTRWAILAQAQRIAATETIRAASQSPLPALRAEALRMAAKIGGGAAARVVVRALQDADTSVRRTALTTAERLLATQSPTLVPPLRAIANDERDPLRLDALAALGGARTEQSSIRAQIAQAARSPLVILRRAAAHALARSNGDRKLLDRLLADSALEVRRAATGAQAVRWAATHSPARLARILRESRANRQRRLAAVLALHLQRDPGRGKATEADGVLQALSKSRSPIVALLSGASRLLPAARDGHTQLAALLAHVVLF